jgi:hypothetical protein
MGSISQAERDYVTKICQLRSQLCSAAHIALLFIYRRLLHLNTEVWAGLGFPRVLAHHVVTFPGCLEQTHHCCFEWRLDVFFGEAFFGAFTIPLQLGMGVRWGCGVAGDEKFGPGFLVSLDHYTSVRYRTDVTAPDVHIWISVLGATFIGTGTL